MVWDEVRRINEQGTTVFLTTQYLEEADQLCDRLAIIDDGRIVREGTPAALKADLRSAAGSTPSRRSTTCSSTSPAARANAAPARSRRCRHERTALVLGERALREAWRTPDALLPTLFIPLFFLVVNVGQAAKIFPSSSTDVPARPELRRVPAAQLAAAGRVVRHRRAVPRRGDRGRLLRQAARGAGLAHARWRSGRLIAEAVKTALHHLGRSCCSRCRSASDRQRHRSASSCSSLLTALWAVVLAGFLQLDRAQDAQRGGHELGRADLLPAAVPDAELRAARAAHAADGDRGDAQPRHLRHGGDALADPRRPRLGVHLARLRRRRWCSAADDGAQRPDDGTLRLSPVSAAGPTMPCPAA